MGVSAQPFAVERAADGGHAAVHHVAGSNDVGAGAGQADGGAGQQFERGSRCRLQSRRRFLTTTPQWPWLVYSQRQTSAMRTSFLAALGLLERAQALLHDAVVVPGAGALLVFGFRQAEEQQAADAELRGLFGFADGFVDGEIEDAGHGADRRCARPRRDRERGDRSGRRARAWFRAPARAAIRCGAGGASAFQGSSWIDCKAGTEGT